MFKNCPLNTQSVPVWASFICHSLTGFFQNKRCPLVDQDDKPHSSLDSSLCSKSLLSRWLPFFFFSSSTRSWKFLPSFLIFLPISFGSAQIPHENRLGHSPIVVSHPFEILQFQNQPSVRTGSIRLNIAIFNQMVLNNIGVIPSRKTLITIKILSHWFGVHSREVVWFHVAFPLLPLGCWNCAWHLVRYKWGMNLKWKYSNAQVLRPKKKLNMFHRSCLLCWTSFLNNWLKDQSYKIVY